MPVVNVGGYTIDTDAMKSSTAGMIGSCTRDGVRYFAKKFNTPVEPANNGALSPGQIKRNQKAFDVFRKRRERVNSTLARVAGPGGNIVNPLAWGISDYHWFEVTEFVDGAIPEDQYAEVIKRLDEKSKYMCLLIAMAALSTVHGQGIVHGDLKLTNIMLVRNAAGNYVSKIIDFDGAYFQDDVPLDSITGTVDYFSPEMALYSSCDDNPDMRARIAPMMTTKSDIFTMGLVLHEYLTGEKPKPDRLTTSLQRQADAGKYIYCWQVVMASDKGEVLPQLVIDPSIRDRAIIVLISDMLQKDPERRPAASEAQARLKSREIPMDLEPWPEHSISISKEQVERKTATLRRIELTRKDGDPVHAYEVVEMDGRRYLKTADDLVADGLATPGEVFEEPWPADGISWDMTKIKGMFSSVRRGTAPGLYQFYDKRGGSNILNVRTILMLKLAIPAGGGKGPAPAPRPTPRPAPRPTPRPTPPAPKPAPAPSPTPPAGKGSLWPEDEASFRLNEALLSAKKISFLGCATLNGVKGYEFRIGSNTMFLKLDKCRMMNFIVAK